MEKTIIDKITIYNEDYRKVMPLYPDKYFDLCYDDPEWGIGADKPSIKPDRVIQKNGKSLSIARTEHHKQSWDSTPVDNEFFEIVKSKSREQIIWGVNYYDYLLKGGRIIWDKLNGECDQFDGEIAYCSLHNRIDIIYYKWHGMIQGVYCGRDISKAIIQQGNKKLNEKRRHPTQKPLILEKYILSKYAKPNERILTTHGGSLNSAIACMYLDLECVICEIDPIHYSNGINEIIRHQKLIEIEKQQLSFFTNK